MIGRSALLRRSLSTPPVRRYSLSPWMALLTVSWASASSASPTRSSTHRARTPPSSDNPSTSCRPSNCSPPASCSFIAARSAPSAGSSISAGSSSPHTRRASCSSSRASFSRSLSALTRPGGAPPAPLVSVLVMNSRSRAWSAGRCWPLRPRRRRSSRSSARAIASVRAGLSPPQRSAARAMYSCCRVRSGTLSSTSTASCAARARPSAPSVAWASKMLLSWYWVGDIRCASSSSSPSAPCSRT